MPKFGNFIANIEVDKKELPEYDVQVNESEMLVSCWVPSEAGKKFSVCWQNLNPITETGGFVTMDGIYMSGSGCHKGSTAKVVFSCRRMSTTTTCDFIFSPITYTDDDAYLNSLTTNIGEIKLEIWDVIVHRMVPYSGPDWTAPFNTQVHERSKKLGAHRVQLCDEKRVSMKGYNSAKISKLATFVFTYRPVAILQANGIAPLPAPTEQEMGNNKRKLQEDDVKDEASEAFDEDDGIDERLQKLKDEVKRLESRRAKKRMVKVKVKKEDHPLITNEVIDLT